jgi:hypothetical protein
MNNANIFDITKFLSIFNISQFNILFKAAFLVSDLFAIIFLLVVIKQVFSMDHIMHDSNDFMFIKTFAFMLLFIAVSLFFIAIAIL